MPIGCIGGIRGGGTADRKTLIHVRVKFNRFFTLGLISQPE